MPATRFVGLDVHKNTVVIAVADDQGQPPAVVSEIPHDIPRVLKELRKLARSGRVRCCYEAGPTGFGLCRAIRDAGFDCEVIAPSLIPVRAGDRVKTDRRDAIKLARFHRSGDLTAVHVPEVGTEAMRDLERARDDAKKAERVARHQLQKFLLRHGRAYSGKTNWTAHHLDWVRTQPFDHEAHHRVLADYVAAVDAASERVERLDKDIAELVETWSMKPLVLALQTLRGVRLLSAVIIAAELGDLDRFAHPSQLMAFLGLVPSEHSSGDATKRGHITRAGNAQARRILVESAWSYRLRPSVGRHHAARMRDAPEAAKAIAWKAQHRLHSRYVRLQARGKNRQQTVVAIARELAGFIWAIARQPARAAA